ncbi:hypothetical protein [Rubritalea profundi]|uniref:Uncharacterized protein n=1 Tax=Rubritalea profundi TaxID=1658618 RepID=A0A2S7U2M8_9BACT|nr:hypothetical protein [Rubritalea profundi]PQJ28807.1 hypothetical protein BSZ32_10085 [Rubritalea profundi]
MTRVYIILSLVLFSYFGITLLVEYMNPDVKTMSATPQITGTKLHANGLPDQIIGTFKIDRVASKAWLDSQENLDYESKGYFSSLHINQTQFTFDGNSIWFADQISAISVKIINNDGVNVELRMIDPGTQHKSSHTFFLQAGSDSGVWFSNYSHLEDGQKMLYRARYTKQVE